MDHRERIDSLNEMLIAAMQGAQTDIWTALPGIVQSFDNVEMTCVVQPAIRFRITAPALNTYTSPTRVNDPSGQFAWDKMPLLLDCPVVFPGGGGMTLTFPVKAGDEVLVVFASRCIDAWWQQGGIQNQAAVRMHDLSDGFVIPQVRSQPRRFTVSETAVELRNDAGDVKLTLDPASKAVELTTPGDISVQGANITMTGNVVINGITFSSHVHPVGSGNTGAPI